MTNTLTLVGAVEKLRTGEITSRQLVEDCFTQIDKYDGEIHAFLALRREEALVAADQADKLIAEKGGKIFATLPLLGVPYACKDNFSTIGTETTASSNILKDYQPVFESTVTQRLKDSGAILIGKTNMDAFAHGSSTETSDFGPTKNPWDLDRVPGGSSGGSAAAVAAHMCIFAIGSETAGSIRVPANWCGVTGLKPTYGRVSRYGVIAMASSTDSPGPITKSAADAALILDAIAGKDDLDATTLSGAPTGHTAPLTHGKIKGMKIGKPKSYFNLDLDPGVRKATEKAILQFEELGAEIVEIDLIDPNYSIGVYTILQRSEVSSNLARFDGIRYGKPRTEFGFEAKKRMMLGAYTLSSGYYDQYYSKAQKVRTLIIKDFRSAYEKVDLIIGPVMPNIALKIGESEKYALFGEMADLLQEPSAIAGLCAISMPCGFSENMPVGVQLIGNLLAEEKVLFAAAAYQSATDFHTQFPNLEDR